MKVPGIAACIGGLLLAACSVAPATQSSGPVPLVRGSGSSFTPLVTASSSAPRCVLPAESAQDAGSRSVAVLYQQPPKRQVTVTIDGAGVPTRYIDVRGDLSEADGDVGDRTTIGLYLDQGYAVLSNREAGGSPSILEVPLDDVLTSPRFGNPSLVLEDVLAACSESI